MDILTKIVDKDVVPNYQVSDSKHSKKRQAARNVLVDEEGNVAVVFDGHANVYKIPGGGIDPGEDVGTALKRENLEEAGCDIEVLGELGRVLELRDQYDLEQESFAFLSKVVGQKGEPTFTEKEANRGFRLDWMNIDELIELAESTEPQSYSGYFMKKRDLLFLKKAKEILDARSKTN